MMMHVAQSSYDLYKDADEQRNIMQLPDFGKNSGQDTAGQATRPRPGS